MTVLDPGNRNYGRWSQRPGVSPFLLWINCRALVNGQSHPIPVPPVPQPCVPTAALVPAQMTTVWGRAAYRFDSKHTSFPSTKKLVFCWTNKLNQFNGSDNSQAPISCVMQEKPWEAEGKGKKKSRTNSFSNNLVSPDGTWFKNAF